MADPKRSIARDLEEMFDLPPSQPKSTAPKSIADELQSIMGKSQSTATDPYQVKDEPPKVKTYVPDRPSSQLLAVPNISTAREQRITQPITTSGQPSVAGRLIEVARMSDEDRHKAMTILSEDQSFLERMRLELSNQQSLPANKRSGVLGVVASVLPEIKAQSNEGDFKRIVVEGTLPYVFKLLNTPSAYLAASIETTAENYGLGTAPEGTSNTLANTPERFAKNLAKAIGESEGLVTSGQKAGKVIEQPLKKLGVDKAAANVLTGGLPLLSRSREDKTTGERKERPGLAEVGAILGLGADLLTPSAIEVPYIAGKTVSNATTKVVGEASRVGIEIPKTSILDVDATAEAIKPLPSVFKEEPRKASELTAALGQPAALVENPKFQMHYSGQNDLTPSDLGNVIVIQRKPNQTPAQAVQEATTELTRRMNADGYLVVNRLDPDILTGKVSKPSSPVQGVFYRMVDDVPRPDRVVLQSTDPLKTLDDKTAEQTAKAAVDARTTKARTAFLENEKTLFDTELRNIESGVVAGEPISVRHPAFDLGRAQVSNMTDALRKYHRMPDLLERNSVRIVERAGGPEALTTAQRAQISQNKAIADTIGAVINDRNPAFFAPEHIKNTTIVLDRVDELLRGMRVDNPDWPAWDYVLKEYNLPTPELDAMGLPTIEARQSAAKALDARVTELDADRLAIEEVTSSLHGKSTAEQLQAIDYLETLLKRRHPDMSTEALDEVRNTIKALGAKANEASRIAEVRAKGAERLTSHYSRDVLPNRVSTRQQKLIEQRIQTHMPDVSNRGRGLLDIIEDTRSSLRKKKLIREQMDDLKKTSDRSLISKSHQVSDDVTHTKLSQQYDAAEQSTKTLRVLFDEYQNRISGLSERFKYWARKTGDNNLDSLSQAFNELHELSPNIAIDYRNALASIFTDKLTLRQLPHATPTARLADREAIYTTVREALEDIDLTEYLAGEKNLFGLIQDTASKVDNLLVTKQLKSIGHPFKLNEDIEGDIADLYYALGSEHAARIIQQKAVDLGYELLSPRSIQHLRVETPRLTTTQRGSRMTTQPVAGKVTPEQLREVITTSFGPEGKGYSDFVNKIADIQGRPFTEVYQEFVDNEVGFEMLAQLQDHIAVTSVAESVYELLGSPLARHRLASVFRSDPRFSQIVEHLPDQIKERGAKYLVDTLYGFITSKQPQQVSLGLQLVRQISSILHTSTSIIKQATLAGLVLPNQAYHAVNFATAPLIIYQNLGLPAALKATTNLVDAGELLARIYAGPPGLGRVMPPSKLTIPKPGGGAYTGDDIIRMFQENNLATTQLNYELSTSMKEDMVKYINTDMAKRRSPLTRAGFNINGLKNLFGLQGSNFWSEVATATDNTWKMSVLIGSLRDGDTPAIAIQKTREALFDYAKVNDIEKAAFRNLMWYQSFWRHNLVSTLKNLTTPKGSTRIKNQLMLIKDRPEAENDYSEAKPYLGPTTTGTQDIFGPGIPTAEAMSFWAEQITDAAFMIPGPIENRPDAMESEADLIASKLSSNKLLQILVSTVFEYDLGKRKPVKNTLDDNWEMLFKTTGLLDDNKVSPQGPAARWLDLSYNFDKKTYEFGSKGGRNSFILFRDLLGEVVAGRWPDLIGGVARPGQQSQRDGIPLDSYGPAIEQAIIRGSGLGTSYRKQTILDTINQRNYDLQDLATGQ